ncbi:hypothetical protein [Algibacter mikhailovii]|uniref:hypothetical protein n=1 Tax=Algibacter mikhailovii TaxID=425498 RepID=UPI0024947992|nr:hypothetical protein [Algibacter mikhailovii]
MLLTLFLYLSILSSCDKDDIVALEQVDQTEQENEDEDQNEDSYSLEVVDDTFSINSGSIEVLDVLQNDAISSATALKLKLLTKPNYGNVEIKEDNTIEYIAQETPVDLVDQITYAIEAYDNNGNLISDSGDVTITIIGDVDLIQENNLLFTERARRALKQRFENGYNAGSGFPNDISKVISEAAKFMADPDAHRPVFGDTNEEINRKGHYLHTTAVYAYAVEDVKMANVVATELLGSVKANSLYTSFWKNNTFRWDSTNDQMWVQASKAKKMKDSYYFIKDLQTVLTQEDKAILEAWFKRFAELAFDGVKNRIDGFLGAGWDADNLRGKYYTGNIFNAPEPNPIQDKYGNDMFLMALPQDIYNNRNWDIIGYIHSWAVANDDREKELYCRNFFKVFLKYGVFPDGTIWEIKRNSDAVPTVGVSYGWITTGTVVQIAHMDAMANHFPGDRLYDYKTTEGVLNGSTKISKTPYQGTSTTDGVTEKSLLTLIKAQAKYLRSEANGGWNDIRFYRDTPLNSTGLEQPSAVPAVANLYYKDQELVDLYMYNTSVGYPPKKSISGGYMSGVWDKDSGSWGNMIFGAMWYGQEDNFF